MARDFYAPVLVTAVPKDGQIELRAINDDPEACDVTAKVFAVDMRGRLRDLGTATASVGATAINVLNIEQSRFRTHNQNMTVAARAMADRNTLGHRSYRVATRRQSLSLPNILSMRLRRL